MSNYGELLYLIDDLFILLTIKQSFKWNFENPINFQL